MNQKSMCQVDVQVKKKQDPLIVVAKGLGFEGSWIAEISILK